MEPEAPWAVDQAIALRTGNGAPAGLGTVVPDTNGHVNAAFPLNDRYLALDAFKFVVPNTEATLPGSECSTCTPVRNIAPSSTWTAKALAELVEGLGGAIVVAHSQAGGDGYHMMRELKQRGKLDMLKGYVNIEGICGLEDVGLTISDFKNVPHLYLKGDLLFPTNPRIDTLLAACKNQIASIRSAGGKADVIDLDQPGPWQGKYKGPWGQSYRGPWAGVSHMMMIESNPGPGGKATNLQVMDVILDWARTRVTKPKKLARCDYDHDHHGHQSHWDR